ncbi:PREDICTED: UDP-glycosyltransferase 84B2 isoform X3 [Tarenaya hassleriana]|uniref:UDP-glycosyltransferase 84B2 isoform X1 n=1 Tax=Tarenaya hassleriana TaxID=28532 RepID=UPI00053C6CD2|nr:PREDICTED: UDP-glycosyltransferase 84B2 isoform X1 [Tarenaya hassleriana]XP_010531267.1 PREDICTED: UDP-glycosyltransferase 84B2 isoform X2 [Tarenaya hassleriana]XP_010531268.1 PREDICTED: UDP-glycosyltransferase 84B2 isoform X3 [Tarenaya hassleriana]
MGCRGDEVTHVLMVTLPMQGHINPMLKLAKLLVPRNVHVTLATGEQTRQRLCSGGTPNPSLDLAFFSDHLDDETRNNETMLESLRQVGHKNLSEIITNLSKDRKFSCIISSPFTPWVPGVASAHGIPCAVLWIQACGVFSAYYRYYTNPNAFPDLNDLNQTLKLPALPLLEVRDLPSFILPSSGGVFGKLMEDFVDCLNSVKWVLVNSFQELEPEIIESMSGLKPLIPIGPLVSQSLLKEEEKEDEALNGKTLDLWKSEDSCIEWLDKQAPSSVIYISFGSILKSTENQIASIATALKNKGKPFLWVIRPVERALNDAVLQEMVGQGRGKVVEWGPQEKVLGHVAVACFVTHCGWNSALETVAAGVPVVAYPVWTDQPTDARLLVDVFGVGVRMRNGDGGELETAEVERCITAVTEGPAAGEMRRRAAEHKAAARMAVARDGSSSRNLDAFIGDIMRT